MKHRTMLSITESMIADIDKVNESSSTKGRYKTLIELEDYDDANSLRRSFRDVVMMDAFDDGDDLGSNYGKTAEVRTDSPKRLISWMDDHGFSTHDIESNSSVIEDTFEDRYLSNEEVVQVRRGTK